MWIFYDMKRLLSYIQPSYAKINLFLYILNKRDDGYHNIYTLFSKITLCDYIILEKSDTFKIICNMPDVPIDERNLIYKTYNILSKRYGLKDYYKVYLIKNIPTGSGLGGGSSNAATFLNMICSYEELVLSLEEKADILSLLGSDTSFFLYDNPMIGCGKGEKLYNAFKLPFFYILLVIPPTSISTSLIYNDRDLTLTPEASSVKIHDLRGICDVVKYMYNGFEDVVYQKYPFILAIKESMEYLGARKAMLSGTGSAVFGVFSSRQLIEKAFYYMSLKFRGSRIYTLINI